DAPGRARERGERGQRIEPGLVGRERERAVRVAVGARSDRKVIGESDLVDARRVRLGREVDDPGQRAAEQTREARERDRDAQPLAHARPQYTAAPCRTTTLRGAS